MNGEDKNKRARNEAAEWMARLNARSVASDTLDDFYDWRRDPGNAAAYSEVEQLWGEYERIGSDRDIAAAVREALARPRSASRLRNAGDLLARRPAAGALALLLVLGLVFAGVFAWPRGTIYESGVGEQRLVQLDDGSRLRLDTATRLRVRLSRTERRIDLIEGDAFFDVAHDAPRPFSVYIGPASVTALGTRFDVRAHGGRTVVTLIRGRLNLASASGDDSDNVMLAAGERSELSATGWSSPERADIQAATSWTEGRLLFRNTPLVEAIEQVNRYAKHTIVLEDQGRFDEHVNGSFVTGDVDGFVTAVTTLFSLKAEKQADGRIFLRS